MLQSDQSNENNLVDFNWIWDSKCPNKIKFLLWKRLHNRLPTRSYLHHIGLNINPLCPVCKNEEETLKHIFTTCTVGKNYWTTLGLRFTPGIRGTQWIHSIKNLRSSTPSPYLTWEKIFPFVVWNIWINRNSNNHYNMALNFNHSHAISLALEYNFLTTKEPLSAQSYTTMVAWHKPSQKKFKLNINGAFQENTNTGGMSGVFRDHRGD